MRRLLQSSAWVAAGGLLGWLAALFLEPLLFRWYPPSAGSKWLAAHGYAHWIHLWIIAWLHFFDVAVDGVVGIVAARFVRRGLLWKIGIFSGAFIVVPWLIASYQLGTFIYFGLKPFFMQWLWNFCSIGLAISLAAAARALYGPPDQAADTARGFSVMA